MCTVDVLLAYINDQATNLKQSYLCGNLLPLDINFFCDLIYQTCSTNLFVD